MMKKTNPDHLAIWQDLHTLKTAHTFEGRWTYPEFHLSLHHQNLNQQIFNHLASLYRAQGLDLAQKQWQQGKITEDMPQFLLLRAFAGNSQEFKQVIATRKRMQVMSEQIRAGAWLGATGKPITDVVNIGIGGSDLGPRLCAEAFMGMKNTHLGLHFISDADEFAFRTTLARLNPETTLFLISSKSFTTEETLGNAKMAQAWVKHPQALEHHFIAITAASERAKNLGFSHTLDLGEWVVGRYSSCSAINFMMAIQLGYAGYLDFIQGAEAMDQHFLKTSWTENLPIILALSGIWNINFLNIPSHLILLYDCRLRLFMDYIQQLDMESNGKSVNRQGQSIQYATGPIIWGGLGNQAHHSYYQHLAQGQHQVAIDFINVAEKNNELLNQLCQGRKKALHQGVNPPQGLKFAIKKQSAIQHIQLNQLTPRSLGALIALYEHKIFTQAWLWNINPFDQPGVESAKQDFASYRQQLESS